MSSGTLEGDQVGRTIARQRGVLGRCYAESGDHSIGHGVVYALLDITAHGTVRRVTLGHTDIQSARFENCIRQELAAIHMPISEGPSTAQVHLVFGAQSEDHGRELLATYRSSRASESDRREPSTMGTLRSTIQSCYERVLRSHPGLRGRTVLELTLAEDGSVAQAALSDDQLGDSLGFCILSAVRNMRLAMEEPSVVTLQYPVILEPGSY